MHLQSDDRSLKNKNTKNEVLSFLSCSHVLALFHTYTHTHPAPFHPDTHTHTHTHTQTHTHTHAHAHALTLTHSHSHTHRHTQWQALPALAGVFSENTLLSCDRGAYLSWDDRGCLGGAVLRVECC